MGLGWSHWDQWRASKRQRCRRSTAPCFPCRFPGSQGARLAPDLVGSTPRRRVLLQELISNYSHPLVGCEDFITFALPWAFSHFSTSASRRMVSCCFVGGHASVVLVKKDLSRGGMSE